MAEDFKKNMLTNLLDHSERALLALEISKSI
jgi:hypothetical protein